jgi:hypothetical protein
LLYNRIELLLTFLFFISRGCMIRKKDKERRKTTGNSSHTDESVFIKRKQRAEHQGRVQNMNTMIPDNILFLQGVIGNQAVSQLMAKNQPEHINEEESTSLQLKKDDEKRAEKHKRVAMAQKAIKLLKDHIKKHIFYAIPSDGKKTVDKDNPVGLHAYVNKKLPSDIEQVRVTGVQRKVHGLEWKYKGKKKTKRSTMFPNWMSIDYICTLIALEFPENKEVVKKYLLQGHTIAIGKTGKTVYPIHGELADWLDGK